MSNLEELKVELTAIAKAMRSRADLEEDAQFAIELELLATVLEAAVRSDEKVIMEECKTAVLDRIKTLRKRAAARLATRLAKSLSSDKGKYLN